MLVSSTVRYALSAVVYLAGRAEEGAGSVPMQEIAGATDIPSNYLSKLLHKLVQEGVLQSSRGPSGGFAFAVPPEELTLAQIARPFTPSGSPMPCLLRDQGCDMANPCLAHEGWSELAQQFRSYFEQTTVAVLRRDGEGG